MHSYTRPSNFGGDFLHLRGAVDAYPEGFAQLRTPFTMTPPPAAA
jgi:hypothetical protein